MPWNSVRFVEWVSGCGYWNVKSESVCCLMKLHWIFSAHHGCVCVSLLPKITACCESRKWWCCRDGGEPKTKLKSTSCGTLCTVAWMMNAEREQKPPAPNTMENCAMIEICNKLVQCRRYRAIPFTWLQPKQKWWIISRISTSKLMPALSFAFISFFRRVQWQRSGCRRFSFCCDLGHGPIRFNEMEKIGTSHCTTLQLAISNSIRMNWGCSSKWNGRVEWKWSVNEIMSRIGLNRNQTHNSLFFFQFPFVSRSMPATPPCLRRCLQADARHGMITRFARCRFMNGVNLYHFSSVSRIGKNESEGNWMGKQWKDENIVKYLFVRLDTDGAWRVLVRDGVTNHFALNLNRFGPNIFFYVVSYGRGTSSHFYDLSLTRFRGCQILDAGCERANMANVNQFRT